MNTKTKIFSFLILILVFFLTSCETLNIKESSFTNKSIEYEYIDAEKNNLEVLDEHEHDHSVEIEGKELRFLTITEIAKLWEIDEKILLSRIINEFNLENNYTVNTILDDMRNEYKFSPAIIKDIAEDIKNKQ